MRVNSAYHSLPPREQQSLKFGLSEKERDILLTSLTNDLLKESGSNEITPSIIELIDAHKALAIGVGPNHIIL
ncbi:MAG: hypothetical protein CUN55_21390, partial [Phototrophicales bacterium]